MKDMHVGDRVRFSARGRIIEGTVTGVRLKRPGSRSRLIREYGLPTITIRMLHVVTDSGVWTVPERSCKHIGVAQNVAVAIEKVRAIERQIRDASELRREELRAEAEAHNLTELDRGDRIEVQFRGGYWVECRFQKFTGTGMIGFYREGDFKFDALGLTKVPRVRFVAPQFVRIPAIKAVTK